MSVEVFGTLEVRKEIDDDLSTLLIETDLWIYDEILGEITLYNSKADHDVVFEDLKIMIEKLHSVDGLHVFGSCMIIDKNCHRIDKIVVRFEEPIRETVIFNI